MTRTLPWVIASAVIALSLALAGCSDSDDGEAAGNGGSGATTATATATPAGGDSGDGGDDDGGDALTIDPCGLLTQEEISDALGTEVGPGIEDEPFGPLTSCSFEDADGFPAAQVVVLVYGDADEARSEFVSTLEDNDYEEIEGLGERAFTSVVYDVSVLSGRVDLSIDLVPQTDAQLQAGMVEQSVALARIALERLP